MKRIISILAVCLLTSSAAMSGSQSMQPQDDFAQIVAEASRTNPFDKSAPQTIAAYACCKVCTKGKPCGDTCIAQDKTCHVGPGCAC